MHKKRRCFFHPNQINPQPDPIFFAHRIDDGSEDTFLCCRACKKKIEKYGWDFVRIKPHHNIDFVIKTFNGKVDYENFNQTLNDRLALCLTVVQNRLIFENN